MHGRTFGRRVVDARSPGPAQGYIPVRPDADGETRIMPTAMWEGPHGDLLREHGFAPDDPTNLALTPERARALEDAATDRMNALVAKVNAHIPGVTVIPWAMIPWSVWEGLNAQFLIKADFCPSSPWNNLLLPADVASADFLGLPQHPRAGQPGLDENLSRLVSELRTNFHREIAKDMVKTSAGGWSALERLETLKTDRFQKFMAMTRYVAVEVFGEEAIAQHDEHFGLGLSKVTE